MNKAIGLLGGLCLLAMVGGPAQALTLNLTVDHCSNPPGPCGPGGGAVLATMTLTDTAAGVDFSISPAAGFLIHTGGNGLTTFSFSTNVALDPTDFHFTTPNFVPVLPNPDGNGFGNFTAGVDGTVQQPSAFAGPLVFSVDGLNFNNFIQSTGGNPNTFFALDILGLTTGRTGLVGFAGLTVEQQCTDPNGCLSENPIPAAVWLFGTVLAGGAGFGRWRKKRKQAA